MKKAAVIVVFQKERIENIQKKLSGKKLQIINADTESEKAGRTTIIRSDTAATGSESDNLAFRQKKH